MQEGERWIAVGGFGELYGCTVCIDDARGH
jgi:hypothetical protein